MLNKIDCNNPNKEFMVLEKTLFPDYALFGHYFRYKVRNKILFSSFYKYWLFYFSSFLKMNKWMI